VTTADKLKAASPEVRQAALALMDELSAPMHPREIERALCRAGLSRSKARPIVNVLKHLPIIAIGAGER
jgi:endonuclease III